MDIRFAAPEDGSSAIAIVRKQTLFGRLCGIIRPFAGA
jgi:hypothetical protein